MSREPTRTGFLEAGEHRVFWELHSAGKPGGGREAVCLLNGLAMHTKAWYGFVPELTDRWDVVLYDYLGQGESSSPDEAVTTESLKSGVEWTTRFMELIGNHTQ